MDIHQYLRLLEDSIIQTCRYFGLEAGRIPGLTGVWLDDKHKTNPRKICAIGVRTSRWVTMHGFAFNINTNLSYFNHIVPCGISDKAVTSLEAETGHRMDESSVTDILLKNLTDVFGMKIKKE
jgi:lipoyl(octanoyl) transferase